MEEKAGGSGLAAETRKETRGNKAAEASNGSSQEKENSTR